MEQSLLFGTAYRSIVPDGWPGMDTDHRYPSECIATTSVPLSPAGRVIFYQQYAGSNNVTYTADVQSPCRAHLHPFEQTRRKTQSWPSGIFPTALQVSDNWHQPSLSGVNYVQDFSYPRPSGTYHGLSLSHSPPPQIGGQQMTGEPDRMPFGIRNGDDLQLSPEFSNSSNSITTPQSVVNDISIQSTPIPIASHLDLSGTQPQLLGLNCDLGDGVILPMQEDPAPQPKRARQRLVRSQSMGLPLRSTATTGPRRKRSHICDYCELGFTQRKELLEHLAQHGVEKEYVPCYFPNCTKSYGRRADVNRHVRSFHKKDSVSCESCNKGFVRKDSLIRHNNDNLCARALRKAERKAALAASVQPDQSTKEQDHTTPKSFKME